MDILTALSNNTNYSPRQLQLIIGAWVMTGLIPQKKKISLENGDVAEGDYDKRSIYALLYSLYHAMGDVKSDQGVDYEMTFNTWGYSWPPEWGEFIIPSTEPQRFGMAAYLGLFAFPQVREYIKARNGKVHVAEMGCGTGAGADLICSKLLKDCTYEAIDMQKAAIETCKRKFVPNHGGRLVATCGDATKVATQTQPGTADFVAVCETHVTEMPGVATEEDRRFFATAHRLLKPGGYLVWGNAIPESTWKPCFDVLESVGLKVEDVRDVTKNAIKARDDDARRAEALVQHCLDSYYGFKIPILGHKKRIEAEAAIKNFYRHPGTNLYRNMQVGIDTYKVVCAHKAIATA